MQPDPERLPAARRILSLARGNKAEAERALAGLTPEEQVAVVCEAPLAVRSRLLDLLPDPERVIPLLPEADLCFTCKFVGVHDAAWILALASEEQITACIDLDAWRGLEPDPASLDMWMASLAEAGDETLLRAARALDSEIVALYLRSHVSVALKPSGDEDWEPPDGSRTLEGQFFITAKRAGDDLEPLLRLLHVLFSEDYWLYFRMLQSVIEEQQAEIEEWALRWRTGRLEDLGFPSWDRAMRIYGHLHPARWSDIPEDAKPLDVSAWALPAWISDLPAAQDAQHSLFRAVAMLDESERRAFLYAFIALANMVAVADRKGLGDADTLPETIEKAARVASRGLEQIAIERGLALVEVIRRVPLERLFRVGVNVAPDGVRPSFSQTTDAEQDGGAEPADGRD